MPGEVNAEEFCRMSLIEKPTHQDYPDELYKEWVLVSIIVSIRDILTKIPRRAQFP